MIFFLVLNCSFYWPFSWIFFVSWFFFDSFSLILLFNRLTSFKCSHLYRCLCIHIEKLQRYLYEITLLMSLLGCCICFAFMTFTLCLLILAFETTTIFTKRLNRWKSFIIIKKEFFKHIYIFFQSILTPFYYLFILGVWKVNKY